MALEFTPAIQSGITFFNYPAWGRAENPESPEFKAIKPLSLSGKR